MAYKTAIIILAAGRGSRFDRTGKRLKLLERLPDGRAVIRAVAESCASVDAHIVVVCKAAHRTQISDALSDLDVQIHTCPNADAGLGATLKCGVASTQPSVGWMIMLGDMPCLQTATIRAVADVLLGGALLTRPYLDDRPGHPVGMSIEMTDHIMNLPDEEGGARLFREHADSVLRIPSSDPGCVQDIDHAEDLNMERSRGT